MLALRLKGPRPDKTGREESLAEVSSLYSSHLRKAFPTSCFFGVYCLYRNIKSFHTVSHGRRLLKCPHRLREPSFLNGSPSLRCAIHREEVIRWRVFTFVMQSHPSCTFLFCKPPAAASFRGAERLLPGSIRSDPMLL